MGTRLQLPFPWALLRESICKQTDSNCKAVASAAQSFQQTCRCLHLLLQPRSVEPSSATLRCKVCCLKQGPADCSKHPTTRASSQTILPTLSEPPHERSRRSRYSQELTKSTAKNIQSSNLFKKVKCKVRTFDQETLEAQGYPELGAYSSLLISAESGCSKSF